MHTSTPEHRIEKFVRAQFGISPTDPNFGRKSDLFEGGYVDSVGVAELMEFFYEEFGFEIPDDDLLSDDFSTVAGIARIVSRNLDARDSTRELIDEPVGGRAAAGYHDGALAES